MLELLAPAGDINSFYTAINCGADAVYLGLSDFNARRKAENFDADSLSEHIRNAHFFGVKVYITLNTLVRDEEMPSVLSLVRAAVEAKADAFIVQDLGVAKCLKQAFPNIVLHASTQLGVHNVYGAKIAQELGFSRVVLSRETKLEDIKAIRAETSLEIEFFVQGALCVAFSGNCYLSSVEQNASGNRGLCKQLCRLPYTATVGNDTAQGYLLSAKDLCLADSIKELAEAGVTSFKIEGRLRRDDYVGRAVGIYRQIIDGIDKGTKLTKSDENALKIAFSRGDKYAERAYLDSETPNVIESGFNNHTGLEIGKVEKVEPFKTDLYRVTITSNYALGNGCGLKFFEKITRNNVQINEKNFKRESSNNFIEKCIYREVASLGVGDLKECGNGKYSFVTKTKVKENWLVHLISEAANREKTAERKRDITMSVKACVGTPLTISASCFIGDKAVAHTVSADICERAKTSPVSADEVRAQCTKTADSGFNVASCEVETDGVFIAKSAFNALRRELLSTLKNQVISATENNNVGIEINAINLQNSNLNSSLCADKICFMHNGEQNRECSKFEVGSRIMVLCPARYDEKEVRKLAEDLAVDLSHVALQLPVIANGRDLKAIEDLLSELPQIKTLVSENIYGLAFREHGYKVIAGAGHNVLNSYAADTCIELGAQGVLASVESGCRENICGEEIPLMTFAHCPYKTVYGNDCAHCSYKSGMTVSREGRRYRVRRTKISSCYFGLF